MNNPSPSCINSLELHGVICILREDWERVKAKIESEVVNTKCEGCYLTLKVNEHGNLSLECSSGPGACSDDRNCCLDITFDHLRGHRAACSCKQIEGGDEG